MKNYKTCQLSGTERKRLCLVQEYPNGKSGCISNVKNTRARSFEGELVKGGGGMSPLPQHWRVSTWKKQDRLRPVSRLLKVNASFLNDNLMMIKIWAGAKSTPSYSSDLHFLGIITSLSNFLLILDLFQTYFRTN